MITIVGFAGTLVAVAIVGAVIANMSAHRLTGVRASGIRPLHCGEGGRNTPGSRSRVG